MLSPTRIQLQKPVPTTFPGVGNAQYDQGKFIPFGASLVFERLVSSRQDKPDLVRVLLK